MSHDFVEMMTTLILYDGVDDLFKEHSRELEKRHNVELRVLSFDIGNGVVVSYRAKGRKRVSELQKRSYLS